MELIILNRIRDRVHCHATGIVACQVNIKTDNSLEVSFNEVLIYRPIVVMIKHQVEHHKYDLSWPHQIEGTVEGSVKLPVNVHFWEQERDL